MKALVKYAPGVGNVGIREVPVPEPGADELLIRVRYCGICGTDLHIDADEFPNDPPVIIGHEYCGTVVRVGADVQGRWQVGERVVGELHTGACGTCTLCLAGKPHICDEKRALGSRHNGAFAEFLAIPAWLAHPIPDDVPWEVAGVTEPLAISAHCLVERGRVREGQSVLISGSATMGLMATLWCRRQGAGPIIVSGTAQDVPLRFPLAQGLGATRTVNVQSEDLVAAVRELTDGIGVDVWVECSGAVPAIRSGVDLVRKTGSAVLIGLVGDPAIAMPWNLLLYKELDLVGCFSSPPSAWELALAAERDEAEHLRRLVTAILPLERWEEGFGMMRRGEGVKILIDMEA
jgi:L-iditol 2-dehydrogenase